MYRRALVAAAVFALGLAPPVAHAAFPGTNGPIYHFTDPPSMEDDAPLMRTLPPGGGAATDLALLWTEEGVEVSPDGTKIVYVGNTPEGWGIYVADADGENPKRIGDEGDDDPSWSPDGKRIVFSHLDPEYDSGYGDPVIATMDLSGGDVEVIGGGVFGRDPVMSPDGSQIAYVRDSDGTQLMVVDADAEPGIEPDRADWGDEPEWTPDGKSIVYINHGGPDEETLQRVTLGGEEDSAGDLFPYVYEDVPNAAHPSVSPDGTKIVVEVGVTPVRRDDDGIVESGLAIVDYATGAVTPLAGGDDAWLPEWAGVATPVQEDDGTTPKEDKTTTSPAPLTTATNPVATPPLATARSVTPAAYRCVSRRVLTIHVRGKGLRKVRITLNGARLSVRREGGAFVARVDLRGKPKGEFEARISKVLRGGRTVTQTRRYRTCVVGR